MKSLSQFIIETQSGSNKPSSDPWFSDEDKNGKNKSGNKKNVSGNKNDSSKTVSYTHLTLPTKRIV